MESTIYYSVTVWLRLPITTQKLAAARTCATVHGLVCVIGILIAVSIAIAIYTFWRTGSAGYNIHFISGKWAGSVLFIILILCTFAVFWIAKRRDLITTRALIFSACIIPVMAFSLLTFPGFDENLLQPRSQVQIIIFLVGVGILLKDNCVY